MSPGAKAMSGSRCRTLYPFSGERHGQGLRFAAGELITLLQVPDGGWWEGEKEDGLRGWFPASYVQLLEVRGEGRALGGPGLRSSARSQTCCPHQESRSRPYRTCAPGAAASHQKRSSALLGAAKGQASFGACAAQGIAPSSPPMLGLSAHRGALRKRELVAREFWSGRERSPQW